VARVNMSQGTSLPAREDISTTTGPPTVADPTHPCETPPYARGGLNRHGATVVVLRNTPACAGRTLFGPPLTAPVREQPRTRGEDVILPGQAPYWYGTPPPAGRTLVELRLYCQRQPKSDQLAASES
jgi:hypothetical protein